MLHTINIAEALKHLRSDPVIAEIIDNVPQKFAMRIIRNKYRALVEAIITQQLSGHSASAISNRFKELYDAPPYPKPADVLATPDAMLKKTGLSVRKVECIKEISQRINDRQIKLENTNKMSDMAICDMLTETKGIGRWTAEMFLIFGLGRTDVLPVGDLGLRKGVRIFYNLQEMPSEETVEKIAEKWRPYRTIATWYIWKAQ